MWLLLGTINQLSIFVSGYYILFKSVLNLNYKSLPQFFFFLILNQGPMKLGLCAHEVAIFLKFTWTADVLSSFTQILEL